MTAYLLVAFSILACALRVSSYLQPVPIDIAIYAVLGHEWLGGRVLYVNLWDNKPPLIYWVYALSEKLMGYGPLAIYGLNCVCAVLVLWGVYAATRRITRLRVPALVAAGLWVAVSGDLRLEAQFPNAEALMNACLVWAFYFMVRLHQEDRCRDAALAGLFIGLAALLKHVVVIVLALWGLSHIFCSSRAQVRRRIATAALAAATASVGWVCLLGYYRFFGPWEDFLAAVFRFNTKYVSLTGSTGSHLLQAISPRFLLHVFHPYTLVPIFLLGIGTGLGFALSSHRRSSLRALFVSFALGTHLMVALPGRFYAHYYQLWLPLLCIGMGVALHIVFSYTFSRLQKSTAVLMALTLGSLLFYEGSFLRLSPEQASLISFGPRYLLDRAFGEHLGRLLRPEETFFHFGHEASLYFYSRRKLPTELAGITALYVGSPNDVAALRLRVQYALEASRPALWVTLPYLYDDARHLPFSPFLWTAYHQVPALSAGTAFIVFARRPVKT